MWFYPFALERQTTEPTTRLVDDVLSTMSGDIPGNIIDRVFVAIEPGHRCLERYEGLCARMGHGVLNARIGYCTRVAAGLVATRERQSARTSLAKTFTILRRP